jgi:hypothetical protein
VLRYGERHSGLQSAGTSRKVTSGLVLAATHLMNSYFV